MMTPEAIADMETMKMGRETEGPKPGHSQVDTISIKKAEGGGHVVTHEMARRPMHTRGNGGGVGYEREEPKVHPFSGDEHGKMMNHIGKHLGIKGSWHGGGADAEEGDARSAEEKENEAI